MRCCVLLTGIASQSLDCIGVRLSGLTSYPDWKWQSKPRRRWRPPHRWTSWWLLSSIPDSPGCLHIIFAVTQWEQTGAQPSPVSQLISDWVLLRIYKYKPSPLYSSQPASQYGPVHTDSHRVSPPSPLPLYCTVLVTTVWQGRPWLVSWENIVRTYLAHHGTTEPRCHGATVPHSANRL